MTMPPQPPYGVGPYGGGPAGFPQPKPNGMAIASLVTGILAVPGICCWPIGLVLGALGVIFGFVGRKQIQGSGGVQTGDGMALAGIICGGVMVAATLVLVIFGLATFGINGYYSGD